MFAVHVRKMYKNVCVENVLHWCSVVVKLHFQVGHNA